MKLKKLKSNEEVNQNLQDMSLKNINEIYKELDTSIEGITTEEAASRLDYFGTNEISYEKTKPWYVYFLKSFVDPFIGILAVIVFVSYFTDVAFAPPGEKSWITIIIITVMILISAILKFTQEYKSQITADNLKDLVPTTTAIKRKGQEAEEMVMPEVVPGDIIHLAAGDLIPADLRIITCKDLFASQSSLTGESEPVEKFETIKDVNIKKNISDIDNIGLMGTIVVSGTAKGVVLQTGNLTDRKSVV